MMKWYQLNSTSPESSQKLASFMKSRRLLVRHANNHLVCCIGDQHAKWLNDIVKEYNTTILAMDEKPVGLRSPKQESYTMPCGEEFFDPILSTHHQRTCTKCRALKTTIARIEPDTEFNLQGVISSLQATKNRLASQLEYVGVLLTNLEQYKDAESMVTELDGEIKGRVEAVKLLIRDGKIR